MAFLKDIENKYKIIPTDFTSKYFLRYFLKNFKNINKNSKVLVVGYLEDRLHGFLSGMTDNLTLVDVRDFPIDKFNAEIINKPIQKINFKEKFDLIVCMSTLQYLGLQIYKGDILEDKSDYKTLNKFLNILKDKGSILISVPVGKCKCPINGKVYSQSDLKSLINIKLWNVVFSRFIYSNYFDSHGSDESIKFLDIEEAYKEEGFIPENFMHLKKV